MRSRQQDQADGTEVVVVGQDGPIGAGPQRERLVDDARQILDRALAPALRDDRFDDPWPPGDLVAALARTGSRPTGYLGGSVDRRRLQLDGLLVEEAGPDEPDREAVDRTADLLWQAIGPATASSGASAVELWGHPARPWHERLAERHGLTEVRALHQLRCALPVETSVTPVANRPFRPGVDEQALIRVNNRAFAAHPDQGGMTEASLAEMARQPWFDPDGIRLHDDPDRPGVLAGFCWTKIHEPVVPGQPRLGEIYAIGVDPDHHGRGLGGPMTAAGLHWLVEQGLSIGMLYVEADNEPALATYDRLGFVHHRTDRAWRRAIGS